ncbi:MAG: hypothetical protein K8R87_09550 [Verrucomicrobia bacterium]|nr:hypothetical protein [Verrucomicrobiota bacterium]
MNSPTMQPASSRFYLASFLAAGFLTLLTGCDQPPSATVSPSGERTRTTSTNEALDLKQRQIAFLNRIREADPEGRTIDRALLNEQNELGLVLDRSVEMDKIPALMRIMLGKMATEFPGEDATVIVYTPSNPPHKIGTGRLNSRTRDMTYTPEK